MQISPQLVPTDARGVRSSTRRRHPAFVLPRMCELPLRLEPVAPDTFDGLVGGHPACRGTTTINHPRGALS